MKTSTFFIFFACLFFTSSSLFAQWSAVSGIYGGDVQSVATKGDTIYLGTTAGIFTSVKEGNTWELLKGTEDFYVKAVRIVKNTIFAYATIHDNYSKRGIYSSSDKGETWSRSPFSSVSYISDFFVATDGTFYFNEGNQISYTKDEGLNWETKPYPNASIGGKIVANSCVADKNKIWINDEDAVYRSTDGGANWIKLSVSNENCCLNRLFWIDNILYVSYDNANIFKSNDFGTSWEKIKNMNTKSNFVPAQTMFKHDSLTYLCYPSKTYFTKNQGQTWDSVAAKVIGADFATTSKGNLIATNTIYDFKRYSLHDLKEASEITNNLKSVKIQQLLTDQATLYLVSNVGIFHSNSLGKTWTKLPLWSNYHPNKPILAYKGKLLANINAEIFSSTDKGETLEKITLPPSLTDLEAMAMHNNALFVGGNHELWRTDDAGVTWTKLKLPSDTITFDHLRFLDTKLCLVSGGDIYLSYDNAASWQTITSNLWSKGAVPIRDVFMSKDNIFVNMYNQTYASYRFATNTWNQNQYVPKTPSFPSTYESVLTFIRPYGSLLVAGVRNDGFYSSKDEGKTWTKYNEGLPFYNFWSYTDFDNQLWTNVGGQLFKTPIENFNAYPITGLVYHDENNNGLFDNTDSPMPNVLVSVATANKATLTDEQGKFLILADFDTQDTLRAIRPIAEATVNPSYRIVTKSDSSLNFGIYYPKGIFKAEIDLTAVQVARPGNTTNYVIAYHNIGTEKLLGKIKLVLDPKWVLDVSTPPYDFKLGDTLIWNTISLEAFAQNFIHVTLNLPSNVPLGTKLHSWVAFCYAQSDGGMAEVQDSLVQTVVGSFDPNDKSVAPLHLTPAEISARTPLEYIIRFQNTGTFPADIVRILDTLSRNFDLSTFKIIAASHAYHYTLSNKGVVEFTFKDIHLADSTNNEKESHGFIKYQITPKANLILGNELKNTASIFFDFNEPVTTNTTRSKVKLITKTLDAMDISMSNVLIYPNPSNDFIQLNVKEVNNTELFLIDFFDCLGKKITSITTQNDKPISVSFLENGVYNAVVKTKRVLYRTIFSSN